MMIMEIILTEKNGMNPGRNDSSIQNDKSNITIKSVVGILRIPIKNAYLEY